MGKRKDSLMNSKINLPTRFRVLFVTLGLILISTVKALRANSWQKRFDRAFLQVDGVTAEGRFRSFQRALKDPELRSDVSKAIDVIREKGFGKGHPEFIEILWPEGTQARRDLEAINALTKQIPERINEFENDGSISRDSAVIDIVRSVQEQVRSGGEIGNGGGGAQVAASSLLVRYRSDPKRFLRLAENILRNAPIELESPSYEVLRTLKGVEATTADEQKKNGKSVDGKGSTAKKNSFLTAAPLELRRYDPFRFVSTPLLAEGSSSYTLRNMGSALTEIFSYLEFGNNVGSTVMPMTTPFFISNTSSKEVDKMFVKLPRDNERNPPKTAKSSRIMFDQFPETIVSTLPFPGICTDEEIKRQKTKLVERVEAAGDLGWEIRKCPWSDDKNDDGDEDGPKFFVLQYNPPGTLPWRRMNEIAVVMERLNLTNDDLVKDEVEIELEQEGDEIPTSVEDDTKSDPEDDNDSNRTAINSD